MRITSFSALIVPEKKADPDKLTEWQFGWRREGARRRGTVPLRQVGVQKNLPGVTGEIRLPQQFSL